MAELDWDEQEFLECIAVLPEMEEYGTEHRYQLTVSEISLTLTLWKHEGTVEIALAVGETKQPITKVTFLVRGRVHCRQEHGRTSLVFPDSVLVPSRFYLAHEWRFADSHPGLHAALQIFPKISLTLTESERRRQPDSGKESWKERFRALCAFGAALAFAEAVFLALLSCLDRNGVLSGLAIVGLICIGVFLDILFQRQRKR